MNITQSTLLPDNTLANVTNPILDHDESNKYLDHLYITIGIGATADDLPVSSVVAASKAVTNAEAVTVLTAFSHNTVKSYQIDETGALTCTPYDQASSFKYVTLPVENIDQLGSLVERLSRTQNSILVRGAPTTGLTSPTRRIAENFPECGRLSLAHDRL